MGSHRYHATVDWQRNGQDFLGNKYSRGHTWSFDGGVSVAASSSPHVVPLPLSVENAIDPEEALVASASACHMLWFLALAAEEQIEIDSYSDEAFAVLGKDDDGKIAITEITLRPRIEFGTGHSPSDDQLAKLHHEAHEKCFIANSLKCPIRIADSE